MDLYLFIGVILNLPLITYFPFGLIIHLPENYIA